MKYVIANFLLIIGLLAATDKAWYYPPPSSTPAFDSVSTQAAIDRGATFLVNNQNKDGSWGSARRTKRLNIYAPVPGAHMGLRAAVTALSVMALSECESNAEEVVVARDAGLAWLRAELPNVRRADQYVLYSIWAHAFSIQALLKATPDNEEFSAQDWKLIGEQVNWLDRLESVDGGWAYYDFRVQTHKPSGDANSFITGTVLIALHAAKERGVQVPDRLIERGLKTLRRQCRPDFGYLYSEQFRFYPGRPVNDPAGSLGRTQVCNLARHLWGDSKVSTPIMTAGLHRFIGRQGWLDMGRKRPSPHESWYAVAGYYFYYGHYYASGVSTQLENSANSAGGAHLAGFLIPLQETNGSWWDFPLYDYGAFYGTPLAMLTLNNCLAAQPEKN